MGGIVVGNPLGAKEELSKSFKSWKDEHHTHKSLSDLLYDAMRERISLEGLDQFASTDFLRAVAEIVALHVKKSKDYGRRDDPYYNVRASIEWGVPGWVGSLIRANDKVKRLQLAAQGNKLANESVEDSMLDLATYALIGLVMWRQNA